jgi:hypothetical protein
MMSKKRYIILLSWLFLVCGVLSWAEEKKIILGREDAWKALVGFNKVMLQKGKWGFLDLVLEYGEYQAQPQTDLLLHFNRQPVTDETGRYRVDMQKSFVSSQLFKLGEGAAAFQGRGGCHVIPRGASLFSAGAVWNDFSIEFWAYPASLSQGETLISWHGLRVVGNELVPQRFECRVEDRRLVWIFDNFFVSPDNNTYSFTLKGYTKLLPRTWHHHLLRYNSGRGLLEYLVDGVPEGVIYTTSTFTSSGSLARPVLGEPDDAQLVIGNDFTGFIDEFRVQAEFVNAPRLGKYEAHGGSAESRVFDLGFTGTRIHMISADIDKPADSEIYFFYRCSDEFRTAGTLAAKWVQFIPGTAFATDVRGRYIQLRVELFPDGRLEQTPAVHEIDIEYEPDLPPISPVGFRVKAGNGKVTLTWKRANEADVKGYMVFYGDGPLNYMGTGSAQGDSPIDAGNVDSFQITGLENGRLYYFSVVAYDSSSPPHLSDFAQEKSARPSEVLE